MRSPRHLGFAFGFPWPDLFPRADDTVLRVRQTGKKTKHKKQIRYRIKTHLIGKPGMGIGSIPGTRIFIYKFYFNILPKHYQDLVQINPSTRTEMLRFKISQHR